MKYVIILILLINITLYGEKTLNICKKIELEFNVENNKSNTVQVNSYIQENNLNNEFQTFNNPRWIKNIQWMQWKLIKTDNYTNIFIANKKLDGFNLILEIGYLSSRSIYTISSLSDEELVIFIKTKKLPKIKQLFPTKEYSSNSFAWRFRNLFAYKNQMYMILGSDWEDDRFNITKITNSASKILCSFNNDIKNKGSFYFTTLFGTMLNRVSGCGYDQRCKGTIGDINCWHDGKKYITELTTKKIKPHLIDEEKYQVYDTFINGDFFRLYSYNDIWTYRFYNTLIAILPLAKNELRDMLMSTYKYNKDQANKLAKHYIAKSLELTLDGHHGAGINVLYEEEKEIKSHDLKKWFKMQEKAINKGYIDLNIKYKFAYNNYSFKNTDTLSLLMDHIEFMSKNKLNNILKLKNINKIKKSLLMYSSHMNNFNSVKSILSFININNVTSQYEEYSCSNVKLRGKSALTYACENSSKDLIALLVQDGADINILDSQKNTLTYYLKKNPYLDEFDKKQGLKLLDSLKTLNIEKLNPSFNCQKAQSRYEKAVCSSNTLSNYDKSMFILYSKLKGRKNFEKIESTQKQWKQSTKLTCESYQIENDYRACLAREIRNRTYFLQKVYEFEEIKISK